MSSNQPISHEEKQRMIRWAENVLSETPDNVSFTTMSLKSPVDNKLRRVAAAIRDNDGSKTVAFAITRKGEDFIRSYGRAKSLVRLDGKFSFDIFPDNKTSGFIVARSTNGGTTSLVESNRERDAYYMALRNLMESLWEESGGYNNE